MSTKQEFDWSEVTGQVVERLRAPKVIDVPAPIVRQAQASFDGVPSPTERQPDRKLHTMQHRFATAEQAKAFHRLIKAAGDHTTPRTSISAVINPDPRGEYGEPTDDRDVSWRASLRKGRKPTVD